MVTDINIQGLHHHLQFEIDNDRDGKYDSPVSLRMLVSGIQQTQNWVDQLPVRECWYDDAAIEGYLYCAVRCIILYSVCSINSINTMLNLAICFPEIKDRTMSFNGSSSLWCKQTPVSGKLVNYAILAQCVAVCHAEWQCNSRMEMISPICVQECSC